MRTGTVALLVRLDGTQTALVEALSDDEEIQLLESTLQKGEGDPLLRIYDRRAQVTQEEEEFGDYVEELLAQPFLNPEIQSHGVQWLKSKLRIEEFKKKEAEATRVIAEYAFNVFMANPERRDFFLKGPTAKVRIKIFAVDTEGDLIPTERRSA